MQQRPWCVRSVEPVAALILLGLMIALFPAAPTATALAAAQIPEPPALDPDGLSDPLSSETAFASGARPSGRARGHYVDEGFRLEVAGVCVVGSDAADVAVLGRGGQLPDGKVSVAFKVVDGGERTGVGLYVRVNGRNSVGGCINVGTGEVTLFKMVEGHWSGLGTRTDGQHLLNLDDWNRRGLCTAGREVWLLLNGEPVVYSAELTPALGGIGLRLVREGRVDDAAPAAAVLSDLMYAPLAGHGQ